MRSLFSIDLEEVKRETRQDLDLSPVLQHIRTGRNVKQDPALPRYYKLQEELSSVDGLLLCREVLAPPVSLQHRLIEVAHESHLSIVVRTKQCPQFWRPKMDIKVDDCVEDCHTCQTNDRTEVTAKHVYTPSSIKIRGTSGKHVRSSPLLSKEKSLDSHMHASVGGSMRAKLPPQHMHLFLLSLLLVLLHVSNFYDAFRPFSLWLLGPLLSSLFA